MKKLILCSLISLLACEDTQVYSNVCNLPCYTGPEDTRRVGTCRDGAPLCDDNNKVLLCEGEVIPEPDSCNGKDDDCNGFIDDGNVDTLIGSPCGTSVGICGSGSWQCYQGEVVCYGARSGTTETCNGKDDDCNGAIDDVGVIDFCYEGDPQTLLYSPCHAGTLQCEDGAEVCVNQLLPAEEVCDEADNDCDGLIDEGLGHLKFDVLFIIDRSCSMIPEAYNEAINTMHQFTSLVADDSAYQFALVGFPEKLNSNIPIKLTDLISGQEMKAELDLLSWVMLSGYEPSYDTLADIGLGQMSFSWRQDALRYVFLWTDEPGQSYRIPDHTESEVAALLPVDGYKFYGFVPTSHWYSFDDIAAATGGHMLLLEEAAMMLQHLKDILRQQCI